MCVPKRQETIWVASYPSCKSAYWIEGKGSTRLDPLVVACASREMAQGTRTHLGSIVLNPLFNVL